MQLGWTRPREAGEAEEDREAPRVSRGAKRIWGVWGGHVGAPMSVAGPCRGPPISSNELARRRDDRFLFRDHIQELVLVVLDREDELAEERLVVFLPQRLVSLREVVALLDLHALQGLDELHRVFAAAEAGLLDPELEEIHGLEVRLDVAVRQRAGRIDLLEGGDGLVEEFLVMGRVQRRGPPPRGTPDAARTPPPSAPPPPAGGVC